MSVTRIAITAAIALLTIPDQAMTQSSGWVTLSKLNRDMKKATKRGLTPVSIDCRHNPNSRRVVVKPDIKVKWVKLTPPRQWAISVLASRGITNSKVLGLKNPRRHGKKLFQTGSKNTWWSCELWR